MPKWRQINQKTRLKTDKSDCAALSYAQFNLSDNFCSWQQSPQSRSRSLSLALCLYPCLPSTHCSSLLLLLLLLTRSIIIIAPTHSYRGVRRRGKAGNDNVGASISAFINDASSPSSFSIYNLSPPPTTRHTQSPPISGPQLGKHTQAKWFSCVGAIPCPCPCPCPCSCCLTRTIKCHSLPYNLSLSLALALTVSLAPCQAQG